MPLTYELLNNVFLFGVIEESKAMRPSCRTRCLSTPSVMRLTVGPVFCMLNIQNPTPTCWVIAMKKQVLNVIAATLTAAVVILSATSAATAQQSSAEQPSAQQPQYQVGGFPITPLQMSVLKPSARINEQQRLSRQPTMDASRPTGSRDFGIGGNTGY